MWEGLVSSFYKRRWELYIDYLIFSLKYNIPYNQNQWTNQVTLWEAQWALQTNVKKFK